jgi:hypothetical protein
MTRDFPRKLAISAAVLGVVGFLVPFWLWLIPDSVELPNSLMSVRITAPDGRVFVVSEPFGRVQRYGPAGFERAFRIDSQGGAVEAGVSPAGNLLICSVRARALITYNPDGVELPPRWLCQYDHGHNGLIPSISSYPSKARVPLIALNWLSAMAVPLWHPFVAWLILMVGFLYLKFSRAAPR